MKKLDLSVLKELPTPEKMSKREVLEVLLSQEYGYLPEEPESVIGEIQSEEPFAAGKAILKKIKLICKTKYGDFAFPLDYLYPTKAEGKAPCLIHINFRGLVPDKYLPAEEIIDYGYAVLQFCYNDISADNGDFRDKFAGMVYPDGVRERTQCGKIGLWAWAAGRVMDYALTLPELDHDHISVAGHSRLGKTALLAGALDERFYCAFSNDSGCSGAALSRKKQGETIRKIYEAFPYWFCENYENYVDKEEHMPFDQHFLLAANVPHRVYVASAVEDLWSDPEHEYLACIATDSYYREHGKKGFIHPDRFPVPGDYFGQGCIGYHLRAGAHYFSREDWKFYIKYLEEAVRFDKRNED